MAVIVRGILVVADMRPTAHRGSDGFSPRSPVSFMLFVFSLLPFLRMPLPAHMNHGLDANSFVGICVGRRRGLPPAKVPVIPVVPVTHPPQEKMFRKRPSTAASSPCTVRRTTGDVSGRDRRHGTTGGGGIIRAWG